MLRAPCFTCGLESVEWFETRGGYERHEGGKPSCRFPCRSPCSHIDCAEVRGNLPHVIALNNPDKAPTKEKIMGAKRKPVTVVTVKSKVCYKCGKRRAASSYWKNSSTVDGLNGRCKPCYNEWRPGWDAKVRKARKAAKAAEGTKNKQRTGKKGNR